MKKLKLKFTGFTEPLTRDEMKKISGGLTCSITCCNYQGVVGSYQYTDYCPAGEEGSWDCMGLYGYSEQPAWHCAPDNIICSCLA